MFKAEKNMTKEKLDKAYRYAFAKIAEDRSVEEDKIVSIRIPIWIYNNIWILLILFIAFIVQILNIFLLIFL